jgi:hypothetical protein
MCSSTCASSQPEPLTIQHPLAPPAQLKEKIKDRSKKRKRLQEKQTRSKIWWHLKALPCALEARLLRALPWGLQAKEKF